MKKGIIIIGAPNTGKSRIARLFLDGKKHISLDARNINLFKDKFLYSFCEEYTEVIHFEDLHSIKSIELLFNAVTDGVTVDKKGKSPFVIKPLILVTLTGSLSDLELGASLESRFDIFELSACNHNYFPITK